MSIIGYLSTYDKSNQKMLVFKYLYDVNIHLIINVLFIVVYYIYINLCTYFMSITKNFPIHVELIHTYTCIYISIRLYDDELKR